MGFHGYRVFDQIFEKFDLDRDGVLNLKDTGGAGWRACGGVSVSTPHVGWR